MALQLRAPRALMGVIALAVFYAGGLSVSVALVAGARAFAAPEAQALMWPAAIATILIGAGAGVRLRRGLVRDRLELARRGAIVGGVVGCTWPLSFGLSAALIGDVSAFGQTLGAALAGAAIGALAGAAGAGLAAFVATTPR
ncbi:MAG: hypothetical protein NW203_04250 [Hyphomonadaceae bacterium]|nr:hypothetical protein [Hyphomonadaceae bacterium]